MTDCGICDLRAGVALTTFGMRFYAKNRGFLTHSRPDATYTERARGISLNRAAGSRLRQRRSRVVGDVHNNKEMGP